MGKIITIFDKIKLTLQSILFKLVEIIRKGGLKLKFLLFMVFTILLTVTIVSSSTITLMKNSIETKSFEVATTVIERISESSIHALLERTYANELNLSELIQGVKKSNKEGLIDISIFARTKIDNNFQFEYIAGFNKENKGELLQDEELLKIIKNSDLNKVSHYDASITHEGKSLETFLFIKPIIYIFKGKEIFLGVSTLQYDKSVITGIIKKVMIIAILTTLFILVLTTILLYFVASKLTKPILSIAQAASQVSKGDLNVELKIQTKDEIEILADKFNDMVKGLRENLKMQKFVSGLTLDMIQDNDETHQLELGGEYKTMTFLFSDIRGFTSMTESKKPAEVIEIVNFYLNFQSNIIKAHGGDIDKFVGDEIMASFYGENSVDNAINAAIDIQRTLREKNKQRMKNGLSQCNVGIGVNHGEVIIGNIGSNDRMDYTSIGHTVNLAARLCSSAKRGEVLVSQDTIELASKEYPAHKMEPIKVKGISKEIKVHSLNI